MAKKITSFIILTIIFTLLSVNIYSAAFGDTTKVRINGQVLKDEDFQVFFTNLGVADFTDNNSYTSHAAGENNFQKIYFEVRDSKTVDKLRIDFGTYPGDVFVKNITFERALTKAVLKPQDIKNVFAHVNSDIDKLEVKEDLLHVYSSHIDPFMYLDNFNGVYNDFQQFDSAKLAFIIFLSALMSLGAMKVYYSLKRREVQIEKWSFAALFFTIISLPYIILNLGIQFGKSSEQRVLAAKPQFILNRDTIVNFPRQFESYIDDNFGLKNYFITLNNYIDVKLLHTSPIDRVTLGKEGWMYLSKEGSLNMMEMYRGITMFTPEELSKIKTNLEERRDYLKSKGIPFILYIAPNKETIYPEYLPDNIKKVQNITRMDQLIAYLKENTDIDVIDGRESLLSNKKTGRLYHKTDTHWNEYGAFFGEQDIMKEVTKYFPDIKVKGLEDYTLVKELRKQGGDLANMLSLANSFQEEHLHLVPKTPAKAQYVLNHNYPLLQGVVTETKDGSLPRLLMFRDSFTINMQPYLSEYFSTAVYQWSHNFDPKLVELTKPDIVIYEVVERYLQELLA